MCILRPYFASSTQNVLCAEQSALTELISVHMANIRNRQYKVADIAKDLANAGYNCDYPSHTNPKNAILYTSFIATK